MFASHAGAAIANARAHGQQRRASAGLEEMVGESAGVPEFVSHQLSASLVAIKESAATVLGSPHSMDSRETRHFLRIIEDHADHMRQLIGNLSNLRDMKPDREPGTPSVTPEPSNLSDLVADATEAFRRRGAKIPLWSTRLRNSPG